MNPSAEERARKIVGDFVDDMGIIMTMSEIDWLHKRIAAEIRDAVKEAYEQIIQEMNRQICYYNDRAKIEHKLHNQDRVHNALVSRGTCFLLNDKFRELQSEAESIRRKAGS